MPAVELSEDFHLAMELVALARDIAVPLFKRGVEGHTKSDGTLVTEADLAVERALLDVLAAKRPNDAVLSEESGDHGNAKRRWIIDPIDGTAWFSEGLETWGTHVALEEDGELRLGVITRPLQNRAWWGVRDQGAFAGTIGSTENARNLRVSTIAEAEQARVMIWSPRDEELLAMVKRRHQAAEPSLDGMLLLAEGNLEALFDADGKPWDLAPVVVLIEEAGGHFFDREGGHRIDLLGGWFTNGRVDGAIRALVPFVKPL